MTSRVGKLIRTIRAPRSFCSSQSGFRAVFLGAPGVGKGTFASRIGPHYNVPILSTGDMIRSEIRQKSEIGLQVKAISERGDLVPDEIVTAMAKAQTEKSLDGWILDGFPRTITQAEALQTFAPPNLVINLNLPEDILLEKIISRRVCKSCGENYNLADINRSGIVMGPLLPKKDGFCDKCDGELIQRSDDTEDVVRNRLTIYNEQTVPLINFYQNIGKLLDFQIKTGVKDLQRLIDSIDSARAS
uniref:Adenylate kinase n=1 Tax=Hirondellea gigas TaxID=1518452 RepID=A0A6A7GD90_9CRUS